MDKYCIILPNEKARTYTLVTGFILLLNLLLFGYIYFNTIDNKLSTLSLWGTVISVFSFALIVVNRLTRNRYPFPFEVSFFIISVLWFLTDRWLLALCILCFAIIGIYTRRKLELGFTHEGISYPSLPKKLIRWHEVSNVVLKDGILTIDLKNNKLIQSLVSKESAIATNEREFNLFCKECLRAGTKVSGRETA